MVVWIYAIYFVVSPFLGAAVLGFDQRPLPEFAEQVVCIGVAEEVFFQGYYASRLCSWLCDLKRLLCGGLIFGVAHGVSRVNQHGLDLPLRDSVQGLRSFSGVRFWVLSVLGLGASCRGRS
ncbi:MAG: CPBP family glutamic-type intramembrane protease [Anaerolineae bacterium]|jgi:membrane protease YdiL (CAAX protease family)